jgi:hypothetical protein
VRGTLWAETIWPTEGVEFPYAVEVPYSTWVSLGSLVLQETVALLVVTPELATELISGAEVSVIPWTIARAEALARVSATLVALMT